MIRSFSYRVMQRSPAPFSQAVQALVSTANLPLQVQAQQCNFFVHINDFAIVASQPSSPQAVRTYVKP
jgi:hypothetical protein